MKFSFLESFLDKISKLKMKTIAYLLISGFLLKTGFTSIAYAADGTSGCGMLDQRRL